MFEGESDDEVFGRGVDGAVLVEDHVVLSARIGAAGVISYLFGSEGARDGGWDRVGAVEERDRLDAKLFDVLSVVALVAEAACDMLKEREVDEGVELLIAKLAVWSAVGTLELEPQSRQC